MPNNQLLDWTIQKAETEFRDDVCLMIEKNQNYLEQDREVRFVNKFVCESKERIGLARTFIINGLGYDLMQYSWEDMERHAEVDYYCCLIADSTLVYYKSEEDKNRFYALRERFYRNLSDKSFMHKRALEWLRDAMEVYKNIMFEDSLSHVRKSAGFIADYLSWSVAACNQTYFKLWVLDQYEELQKMEQIPEHFLEHYNAVVHSDAVDELKDLAHRMITETRAFIKAMYIEKTEPSSQNYWLKEWYEECSYYFRRIYHYCEQSNPTVVFLLSCAMQADLDDIIKEYQIDGLNVLAHFDAADLSGYAQILRTAEKTIVNTIESDGYCIESYASVEEFIRKNP